MSPTLLRLHCAHACVCLFAAQHLLHILIEHILNVLRRLNVHMHFSSVESDSEGLLPEWSIGVKEARSEDSSS